MLEGIKDSTWTRQIQKLRGIGREGANYAKSKAALPAFMLSASTNGGQKAADVTAHSGLLQLDLDKIGTGRVGDIRDRIGEDRHILAAWISPTGDGVKAIMLIPPSVEDHKAAFAAAVSYMHEKYNVVVDPSCSDISRLCFVSHDPCLVVNDDAVSLEILKAATTPGLDDNSSISLNSESRSYILHNRLFTEFPNLRPIYMRQIAKRYGKPQKGQRNDALVEIVASLFCVVASEFVIGFAEEYYSQHSDAFADYDLATYQREANGVLKGCLKSYPGNLSEAERAVYAALTDDRERTAFRIAHSLSKCESDPSVPLPLFFLSCHDLGLRLGIMDTPAHRILKSFERMGIVAIETKGTLRKKGVPGRATVYRWLLK